jgi:hypothetical protein
MSLTSAKDLTKLTINALEALYLTSKGMDVNLVKVSLTDISSR